VASRIETALIAISATLERVVMRPIGAIGGGIPGLEPQAEEIGTTLAFRW
jgi:hypothetical protein